MTNLIPATQGQPIPGWTILQKIESHTKLCTIYHQDDTLVVGFSWTRVDNFWDWLTNLDPEVEALELLKEIEHWIYVYQPAKILLAGHSQGGAHAEIIARHIDAEMVTFVGLPAGGVGTHHLVRSDPMAWFPVRRKGVVIKMGPKVVWPRIKGHDPKTYEELLCRN